MQAGTLSGGRTPPSGSCRRAGGSWPGQRGGARLVSPNGGWPAFGAGGQFGVPSAYQAGVLERGADEVHRCGTRVGGGADVVPVQDVLAQGLVPACSRRGQAGGGKLGRRWVREG